MEQFYSAGGRSNPDFPHQVKINKITDEMLVWCQKYTVKGTGYSQRFYIKWNMKYYGEDINGIFQFECEEPAIMFILKFGGQ